jgi:hypothetical protein
MLFNAIRPDVQQTRPLGFKQIVKGIVPGLFLRFQIVLDWEQKEGLVAWNATRRNGVVFTFR